jgi:hypothetical protein
VRRLEHDLLLRCASAWWQPESEPGLRSLLRAELNWDVVLDLAEQHCILPLVYWSLSGLDRPGVPLPVMNTLASAFRTNAVWSMRLASELTRLVGALQADGVPTIAWKGPASALAAYGHLGLRMFSDLDLLVNPSHFETAASRLRGYGLRADVVCADLRVQSFDGADNLVVELHWAPMPWCLAADLRTNDLQCEVLSIGGRPVAHPLPADLLVLLCAHGGKHSWSRLQWIADIAALIRTRSDLDWARVGALAFQTGTRRLLSVGLMLARQFMKVKLPPAAELFLADVVATQLADTIGRQMFLTHRPLRSRRDRVSDLVLQLKFRERLRDRVRCALGVPLDSINSWSRAYARRRGTIGKSR